MGVERGPPRDAGSAPSIGDGAGGAPGGGPSRDGRKCTPSWPPLPPPQLSACSCGAAHASTSDPTAKHENRGNRPASEQSQPMAESQGPRQRRPPGSDAADTLDQGGTTMGHFTRQVTRAYTECGSVKQVCKVKRLLPRARVPAPRAEWLGMRGRGRWRVTGGAAATRPAPATRRKARARPATRRKARAPATRRSFCPALPLPAAAGRGQGHARHGVPLQGHRAADHHCGRQVRPGACCCRCRRRRPPRQPPATGRP